MSDGVSVFECTSDDEVIDLLRGGQGVFGIALGGVWRDIEGTLSDLPAERAAEPETPAAERRAVPSAAGPRRQLTQSARVQSAAARSTGYDWDRQHGARESSSGSTPTTMTPKGQPPRNLSGTETAYAMATLELRRRQRGSAYAA